MIRSLLFTFILFTVAHKLQATENQQNLIARYIEIFSGYCDEHQIKFIKVQNLIDNGNKAAAEQILSHARGFWYPHSYFKLLSNLDTEWARDQIARIRERKGFASGYHENSLLEPNDQITIMEYKLRQGVKPSAAITSLVDHLIFLDCNIIFQATLYQLLLECWGDEAFDNYFGPSLQNGMPLFATNNNDHPLNNFEVLLYGSFDLDDESSQGSGSRRRLGSNRESSRGSSGYEAGSSASESESEKIARPLKLFKDSNHREFQLRFNWQQAETCAFEIYDRSTEPFSKQITPGVTTYICNHPAYSVKFGGLGAHKGFNVLYAGLNDHGEKLFAGFGLPALMTLGEMEQFFIAEFNKDPLAEVLPMVETSWWERGDDARVAFFNMHALKDAKIDNKVFSEDGGGWNNDASVLFLNIEEFEKHVSL